MKNLSDFLTEMAHSHIEKRTRPVMTPWGEYTGDEEDYEEYVVDKCNQYDWADFLRGKDKLGDNLKNMKLYKIEKTTEFHYDFGDSEKKWRNQKFRTLAIRWLENDYKGDNDNWNEEMYAEDGEDLELAEELFKDIEAYRTGKIDKDEWLSKWETIYNDKGGKSNIPTSELKFIKKDTNEKITVHMSALLT